MAVEGFVDLLNVLLYNCNGKLPIKLSGYGPAPHPTCRRLKNGREARRIPRPVWHGRSGIKACSWIEGRRSCDETDSLVLTCRQTAVCRQGSSKGFCRHALVGSAQQKTRNLSTA